MYEDVTGDNTTDAITPPFKLRIGLSRGDSSTCTPILPESTTRNVTDDPSEPDLQACATLHIGEVLRRPPELAVGLNVGFETLRLRDTLRASGATRVSAL